jgi:hypothetical protein
MFPIPPTMAEAILDLKGFQTLYSVLVVVPSAALSYLMELRLVQKNNRLKKYKSNE